jgi:AP-1 complex subunit mu
MDEMSFKPIIVDKETQLVFLQKKHKNLTFLMISTKDANVVMAFDYLEQLIKIFEHFFKEIDEEIVRDNFVSIYEILDETMDNGYPQLTDPEILSKFIVLEHMVSKKKKPEKTIVELNQKDSKSYLNWRAADIKVRESFCEIKVLEKLEMTLTAQGEMIKSQVFGDITLDTALPGVPQCTMILNTSDYASKTAGEFNFSVNMQAKKFHQCVDLDHYEDTSIIKFVPPHGEFSLMTYTVQMNFFALFFASAKTVKLTNTKVEIDVIARALYHINTTANDLEVHVPVPLDAVRPEFSTETGTVDYMPEDSVVVWKVPQVVGESQLFMKVRMDLPTVAAPGREEYKLKPLKLSFEVPMMTISGITVLHMDVGYEDGHMVWPSIEYTTVSGDYYIRSDSIMS